MAYLVLAVVYENMEIVSDEYFNNAMQEIQSLPQSLLALESSILPSHPWKFKLLNNKTPIPGPINVYIQLIAFSSPVQFFPYYSKQSTGQKHEQF